MPDWLAGEWRAAKREDIEVYKQSLLLWRRVDLSRDAFRKYYDEVHLECIASQLRAPPVSHERSYPVWQDPLNNLAFSWLASTPFDVFATMTFGDESVRAEWRKSMSDHAVIRERIQKDESEFMATERRSLCVLEESRSNSGCNANELGEKRIDVLRLVKYGRNDFDNVRGIHEQRAAFGFGKLNDEIVSYCRNYIVPEHPWSYHLMPAGSEVPLRWSDVVEELTFKTRSGAREALRLLDSCMASPGIEITTVVVEKSKALPRAWVAG